MAKRTFLCLTDLHYADPRANPVEDVKQLGSRFRNATHTAFDDLDQILTLGFVKKSLDFVAVAGDITTYCDPKGFVQFQKNTLRLLQKLVKEPEAICIVPGNHDVKWHLDPHESGYFENKFDLFKKLVDSSSATGPLIPVGRLSESDEHIEFSETGTGPVFINESKQILVLNINSALRCGELDTDMLEQLTKWSGKHIDPSNIAPNSDDEAMLRYATRDVAQIMHNQKELLQKALAREKNRLRTEWADYLKVAIVHHHVCPFPLQAVEHKSYEFMLDSSALLELLTGFDFDLVLTGHKHHSYDMVHHFNGKAIFVVGGPTVGGRGDSRGIRQFEFDSSNEFRTLHIRNIPLEFAHGDVKDLIDNSEPISLTIPTPSDEIFDQNLAKYGYSYGEFIATTKITEVGDAERSIEFEGLILKDPAAKVASIDRLNVPTTSGYLDGFKITPSTAKAEFDDKKTLPRRQKKGFVDIRFRNKLRPGHPVSYQVDWTAVNAIALDSLNFDRKYSNHYQKLDYIEFTHFQPIGPCRLLTMLVQFPPGVSLPELPALVVAKPDPSQENAREWVRDEELIERLLDLHALRYFPSVNVIALRVEFPNPERSYRIEWKVPDGQPKRNASENVQRVSDWEKRGKLPADFLRKILADVREVILRKSKWRGELDGNVMIFDLKNHPNVLKTITALRSKFAGPGQPEEFDLLSTDIHIDYGLGIAGRAFRANQIELYVEPKSTGHDIDYYWPVTNTLYHKKLLCVPLHIPVSYAEFKRNGNVYSRCEPYGIFNIGSEQHDCPLSADLLERIALRELQHELNQTFAQLLFGFSTGKT